MLTQQGQKYQKKNSQCSVHHRFCIPWQNIASFKTQLQRLLIMVQLNQSNENNSTPASKAEKILVWYF